MATYRASITFDLPDGEGIDAATATFFFVDRLQQEPEQFTIDSVTVERI